MFFPAEEFEQAILDRFAVSVEHLRSASPFSGSENAPEATGPPPEEGTASPRPHPAKTRQTTANTNSWGKRSSAKYTAFIFTIPASMILLSPRNLLPESPPHTGQGKKGWPPVRQNDHPVRHPGIADGTSPGSCHPPAGRSPAACIVPGRRQGPRNGRNLNTCTPGAVIVDKASLVFGWRNLQLEHIKRIDRCVTTTPRSLNHSEITVGYKSFAPGYNLDGRRETHFGADFTGSTFAGNTRF